MRLIVDEIPKKVEDCIFSRHNDAKYDICIIRNNLCKDTSVCPYLKSIKDYHAEKTEYVGDGYNTQSFYPLVNRGGSDG